MNVTSAAGIISLLEDRTPEIKSFALKRLDSIVDEFWPEISESIEKIEMLHENKIFKHRKLAALVASKVYYHLGAYEDSLNYALGAGTLFDVNSQTQYVDTIIAKCIDQYTGLRQAMVDENKTDVVVDQSLEAIVNRMFQRCLIDKQYKQALGIALETRRLDIFQSAILKSGNIPVMLKYSYDVVMNLTPNRAFRGTVLRNLVELYRGLAHPDYINVCQCLIFLDDSSSVAQILKTLIAGEQKDQLIAYQIGFDLYESATQEFLNLVLSDLKSSKSESLQGASIPAENIREGNIDINEYLNNINKLETILSGEISISLHLQFLIRSNKTDFLILKHTKDSVRASICHTAVVIANAFMSAGTTSDYFLRENLEWLSRASNWSKMTAVSSLGVIHRGHERDALTFMQTYLPKESGPTAGYTESGALFALGLIHANHGTQIIPYLLQQIQEAPNEIIKHGGCLGLGLAAMGTRNGDLYEQIKFNLYQDDAVVGEAAGIAMGLIMLGSNNEGAIEDMVAYCHESQHEKILRGLAVGIAFIAYGRLEDADGLIQRLLEDKDALLRRSGVYTIAMAYCGSSSNTAIRRLLHVAVSDVNDDVRRAAVSSIGFLMFRTPDQCPSVVSLLAESYNPHVRYGAAMALGVACAGTGLREALTILEPMIQSDRINFVRQGALIASAMICIQHTEQTCSKVPYFRQQYSEVIKDKHEDVMSKFGAILAQGIIDAGGRNVTMSLQSRTGHVNMISAVGTLIFTQYWYWFPLAHCLSLTFTPTCIIGLNSDLNMPKMEFKSHAKPSTFAYPPPTEEKKREEIVKSASALLSIAARRGRREKYRTRMDLGEKVEEKKTKSPEPKKVEEVKDEPEFEIISNPARVIHQQLKVLGLAENAQYVPIKNVAIGGIVMVRNTKPHEGEIVELVAANGPKDDEEKEPNPPEPFEWHIASEHLL